MKITYKGRTIFEAGLLAILFYVFYFSLLIRVFRWIVSFQHIEDLELDGSLPKTDVS